MKKVLFFTISLMSAINLLAQNVGIGTSMPDASARLDVVDANRGLLIPRVALTATNASAPVTNPAPSLLVYNTATDGTAPDNVWPGFYYWDGTKWVRLDTGNGDWKLDGNTNGALRYIGTNDNFDFPIHTNGTEKMRVTTAGNVGIGTTTPPSNLTIANNLAIGPLDNYSEYQILLWQHTDAVHSYGLGIRGGTMVFNSHGYYQFDENGVTRVTFASGGSVGIGTTNPFTRLDVTSRNSGITGTGTSQDGPTNVIIEAGHGSARYYDWPNGWGGGLSTWDIVGAGTYFNYYVTRSDRAYKTNISPIEVDPNFVQKFMQLNPVTYNFNRETIPANEWDYQRLHYGFIANEVEKLFPDIVVNAGLDPSIKRGLEYDAFIPMLVKIVQNQQKTIENLQQENTSLKSEMQELKNELDHLKAYVGLKSEK